MGWGLVLCELSINEIWFGLDGYFRIKLDFLRDNGKGGTSEDLKYSTVGRLDYQVIKEYDPTEGESCH